VPIQLRFGLHGNFAPSEELGWRRRLACSSIAGDRKPPRKVATFLGRGPMILRSVALSLSALVLCAADYPPPPAQLEPYVKDGRFDPGDYGWMKGRFGDATPRRDKPTRR
jgi:hypothetical protein